LNLYVKIWESIYKGTSWAGWHWKWTHFDPSYCWHQIYCSRKRNI